MLKYWNLKGKKISIKLERINNYKEFERIEVVLHDQSIDLNESFLALLEIHKHKRKITSLQAYLYKPRLVKCDFVIKAPKNQNCGMNNGIKRLFMLDRDGHHVREISDVG